MEARRFYIITGGTMVHVAPHFALCAPAFGSVGEAIGKELKRLFRAPQGPGRVGRHEEWLSREFGIEPDPTRSGFSEGGAFFVEEAPVAVRILRTTMAGGGDLTSEMKKIYAAAGIKFLETNEDLEKLVDHLVTLPSTKGIVLAAAVCDWEPSDVETVDHGELPHGDPSPEFGKRHPRLQTSWGDLLLRLRPADKLIQRIRRERKDIFLVGFKATTGMSEQEQYVTGLGLLKDASCNLVFANDVHEHRNMVITPEEAKYHVTKDRKEAVRGLCEMIAMRSQLHFTRSTVVDGDPIPWDSPEVPDSLRTVVNHCIRRGAYKPFKGKTVGHFATRGPRPGVIYTSRRKSNFNELPKNGLLRIDAVGDDAVVAYGAKPSVGGQSQRIIFDEHPDVDCIVHFHCPLRPDATGRPAPPVRQQRPYECGSHECGLNTSKGLREMVLGRETLKAVMLDEHGPNICFSKNTDPALVIEFIEAFFDLTAKTGGPVDLENHRS